MVNNFVNTKCDCCETKLSEERYSCDSCHEVICKECTVECEICGESLCKNCAIECEHCGRKVCNGCLEEHDDINICSCCYNDKSILIDSDSEEEDNFEDTYI